MMQAVAWEYVDSRNVAWMIHGQHSRDKRVYCVRNNEGVGMLDQDQSVLCVRSNECVGMFDPDQSFLEERGISRWPEIVRAKWRDVVKTAGKAVR